MVWLVAAFIGVSGGLELAQAQHVIVLKNGRQITVQSYREEGSTIKFNGLGGEIGLPKDQIQAILKPGQSNRPGVSISDLEASSRQPATVPQKTPAPSAPASRTSTAEPWREEVGPRGRGKGIPKKTRRSDPEAGNRQPEYFDATQGGGTRVKCEQRRHAELGDGFASRIHDSQKVPGGGGA